VRAGLGAEHVDRCLCALAGILDRAELGDDASSVVPGGIVLIDVCRSFIAVFELTPADSKAFISPTPSVKSPPSVVMPGPCSGASDRLRANVGAELLVRRDEQVHVRLRVLRRLAERRHRVVEPEDGALGVLA
jgi:hypothetical protein